nr:immunoglobulin light chain junction region [Macaca mulatta]MOV67085.1 immunoglobulin light chain junction region [Macaca mulatta]MOV67475.1 immunoglobulin light chain junction region [Macaca mulatta]MOV67601.1 immunoglobulin light chain junction region [Macaca mulatta]MOV70104.1 immunoglobulin light chain junction region [Macaca mulatta]
DYYCAAGYGSGSDWQWVF